jgi:S-disulfanyl-L-cysteine oxidoreductase SoxD
MWKRSARQRRAVRTPRFAGTTLVVLTCSMITTVGPLRDQLRLNAQSQTFGVGRTPSPEEIRDLGSAIAPDGQGLPAGSGSVSEGRAVFAAQCARCHGPTGEGDVGARLVGGQGTLRTPRPLKTVGSFWPYATTLWDYINRAMPFDKPGALSPSEVYAASAFILNLNGIIGETQVMDAQTLPKVRMPNRDGFVPDSRPDVPLKPRP